MPRRRISAAEVADVMAAQGALVAALVRTRLRPTGRLVRPEHDAAAGPGAGSDTRSGIGPAAAPEGAWVARAARAVDRASRRGLFRPTCLVRSLALVALLERRGVDGVRMRIGVRRTGPSGDGTGAGHVHAHAWVEVNGVAVGEDAGHLARFTPLGALRSTPRA